MVCILKVNLIPLWPSDTVYSLHRKKAKFQHEWINRFWFVVYVNTFIYLLTNKKNVLLLWLRKYIGNILEAWRHSKGKKFSIRIQIRIVWVEVHNRVKFTMTTIRIIPLTDSIKVQMNMHFTEKVWFELLFNNNLLWACQYGFQLGSDCHVFICLSLKYWLFHTFWLCITIFHCT